MFTYYGIFSIAITPNMPVRPVGNWGTALASLMPWTQTGVKQSTRTSVAANVELDPGWCHSLYADVLPLEEPAYGCA